jgi:ABC-2 type transport system permease protein
VDRECDRYRTIETALNQGAAVLAVVIPPDFPAGVHGERPVTIQVLADGSDANTARLALGYLSSLVLIFSGKAAAVQYAQMGKGILVPPVKMLPRAWFNPDLRSQNNIIPGILAIVMVVIAAMLTSVTVAREWETGTMEQLISTPIRVPELVFGKVAPYFIIGLLDVAIAVAMGQWLFHVPLRGNPALLFLMASIFLTGALFFGLLLSIVLKSQVLANQIALVASYMPTLILSGFVFAISSMPTPLQWLTYIIPARYFIAILRGIYLKGIGLEILWLNALLLTIYAAAMIFMANKCLQLKLE